jgi:hypothetical protein
MKTLLSFCVLAFFLFMAPVSAQQEYTVNGQTYSLKTEVEGPLTLLWNTIDGEYRYFVQKGNAITELKNSRSNGRYQEEYKESLMVLTSDEGMNTEEVKLTRASLKNFVNEYNKKADPNYSSETSSILLKTRLGVFGGVSNSIFTQNPLNSLHPVAGVDLEVIDEVKLRRHSVVLRFKQTFQASDHKYSASQFSLNYRFKFVKQSAFDIFVNTKFVAYTYSKREDFVVVDPDTNEITLESSSGGDLSAPATFGLGADIALGNGFLTLNYNDIVGIGVDSNGEFPVDFTVGYKFNL